MSATLQLRLCAKCGQHVRVQDDAAEPCPYCYAQSAGMGSVELQGPAAGRLNALMVQHSLAGLSRRSLPSAASMAVLFTASAVSFTAACFGVDTPAYGLPFYEPEDIYLGDALSDTVGEERDSSVPDDLSESDAAADDGSGEARADADGSGATDADATSDDTDAD